LNLVQLQKTLNLGGDLDHKEESESILRLNRRGNSLLQKTLMTNKDTDSKAGAMILPQEKKEAERKRLAEAAAKERAVREQKQGRLDRLKVNDSNEAMRDIKASILGLNFG
jgi:hypothetical protein